jgi:tRNA G18 (ribose-2'-O)-methylase SpoU
MRKLKTEELHRLTIEEFKHAEKFPIVIVLDNVRSLNNIGSIFRTADAFMIERIMLCGITAQPPHKDIHKTALGATESVSWEYYSSTKEVVSLLKKQGYIIYAIEQAEKSMFLDETNFESQVHTALIFGNEVRGVQQEIVDMADGCIEINQYGTKHSLNIAVCAGIVIWEIFKKMNKKKGK